LISMRTISSTAPTDENYIVPAIRTIGKSLIATAGYRSGRMGGSVTRRRCP
jgi:hypothetical protein